MNIHIYFLDILIAFHIMCKTNGRSITSDVELDIDDECQYLDTRRNGFQGYFDVTIKSVPTEDKPSTSQDISDTMAIKLHDDIVITASENGREFRIEEVCIETKGIGGMFWQYEAPSPAPRVVTVGDSVFISSVGGALSYSVSGIPDRHVWSASCTTFDGRLEKLTLSPMVVENRSASVRHLRITGCLL